MTKWDYLIEADDPLRRAIKRASEENDPQAYHRALARFRGSNEMVNRWGELEVLNARAKNIENRHQAMRWAKEALSQGFAVVLRRMDSMYTYRQFVDIFTGSRDYWFTSPVRGSWTISFSPDTINQAVWRAYLRHDEMINRAQDDTGFVSARQSLVARSKPLLAAIPMTALPPEIKRQMAAPPYDEPPRPSSRAKLESLIEADEQLRRIWRMHSENPREFNRAMARVRGSKELVDRSEELAALNARAARGFSRYQAIDFARDVLKRGLVVVLSYLNLNYTQNTVLNIITGPLQVWGSSTRYDDWFRMTHRAWLERRIHDAYDNLNTVTRFGVEIPAEDDGIDYPPGYGPDFDPYIEYRPATPEDIQRATPRISVIPFSALPSNIKRQMGLA